MRWMDGSLKRGLICKTAQEPAQRAAADAWIEYSTAVWAPGGQPARVPTEAEAAAMSWFVDKDGKKEPIEPLHVSSELCE